MRVLLLLGLLPAPSLSQHFRSTYRSRSTLSTYRSRLDLRTRSAILDPRAHALLPHDPSYGQVRNALRTRVSPPFIGKLNFGFRIFGDGLLMS